MSRRKWELARYDERPVCNTCGPIAPVRQPCNDSCGISNGDSVCEEILEEFCDNIIKTISFSDCLCEDYGSEIPVSLSIEYQHKLIKNIVDRGRCENQARIFYFGSCAELANATRTYMCCPEEGDIAFVHNSKATDGGTNHGFDVYMLHNIPNHGRDLVCGESVPYNDDCNDFIWLTDCCADIEDIYITGFTIDGDIATITRSDGTTYVQTITHPVQPPNNPYSWVAHKSVANNMIGMLGINKRNLGTYFTIPKTGKYHITGRVDVHLDCPTGSVNMFYQLGHQLKKNGNIFYTDSKSVFAGNYKQDGQAYQNNIAVSWAGTLNQGDVITLWSYEYTPTGFKKPDRVQLDGVLSISWSGV